MRKNKTEEKLNKKGAEGITLIALVVTIIILLILAVVTVNMTLSEQGLVNRAKIAANKMSEEEAKERMNTIIISAQLEFYAEHKELPSLAQFAEILSDMDEEIEYIATEHRPIAKIELPDDIGSATKIYVKLKASGLEFEIDQNFQITNTYSSGGSTQTASNTLARIQNSNLTQFIDIGGTDLVNTTATTDDWRILDKDSNGVYVIMASLLPKDKIPTTQVTALENNGFKYADNYRTYFRFISTGEIASSIDRRDFAINTISNTSNWNFLIPESLRSNAKVVAYGGPTTEQLENCWDNCGKTEGPLTFMGGASLPPYAKDNSGLFNIEGVGERNASGMWTRSWYSGSGDQSRIAAMGNIYVTLGDPYDAEWTNTGIRPVIYLPLDLEAEYNAETEIWTLK